MRHKSKRQSLRDRYPIGVPCGVLIAIIAAAIYVVGTYVPKAPLSATPRAHLSLQETRR